MPPGQRLFEAEAALYNALLAHRQLGTFSHDAGVTWAAFSPKGDRIVTASYDKTARIWSVSDGSAIAVLKGHDGALERASFSPDGNRVVTAAHDTTARIWDAKSGTQLFVLQQPGGLPTAKFSPDGTRVLTAADDTDHAVSIWDARSGANILTLKGGGASLADFSPDGHSFAAGRGDDTRTVGVWNTETGRQIKNWQVQTWPDEAIFSPDGNRLLITSWVTVSYAGVSRLWDVSKSVEIADSRRAQERYPQRHFQPRRPPFDNGVDRWHHAALGWRNRGIAPCAWRRDARAEIDGRYAVEE